MKPGGNRVIRAEKNACRNPLSKKSGQSLIEKQIEGHTGNQCNLTYSLMSTIVHRELGKVCLEGC